jgi:hypothetical protein
MHDQSYKLKSGVAGFVTLPSGGTMTVTIPAGSIVKLLGVPPSGDELTRVRYGDRACTVTLRELQRCGTPVESGGA